MVWEVVVREVGFQARFVAEAKESGVIKKSSSESIVYVEDANLSVFFQEAKRRGVIKGGIDFVAERIVLPPSAPLGTATCPTCNGKGKV